MFIFPKVIIMASALIAGFTLFTNAIARSEITKYDEHKTSDVKDEHVYCYQTLSDKELLNYNAIKSGYRGYVSPNLDPLTLLGI